MHPRSPTAPAHPSQKGAPGYKGGEGIVRSKSKNPLGDHLVSLNDVFCKGLDIRYHTLCYVMLREWP